MRRRAGPTSSSASDTQAASVTVNGTALPQLANKAAFDAAGSGGYNAGGNLVVAKSASLAVTSAKTFVFTLGQSLVSQTFTCRGGTTTTGQSVYAVGSSPQLGAWSVRWDLAGFSGPAPDAELYLRAAGASTFMPVMQYHSEFNQHQLPLRDRTPWHVADMTGDGRVVPVFRECVHLRERLVDYLTDQASETIRTDRPLMRALFFDHPGDANVWEHPRQWMLGNDLLVNPVTLEGAGTWSTYLPSGEWVDVWTGEPVGGGQLVDAPYPSTRFPSTAPHRRGIA